jgi:hypothetical protein
MFPDNPEINDMINLLKANQEGQTIESIKKENSKISAHKVTTKSITMPTIEVKVAPRPQEKSNHH